MLIPRCFSRFAGMKASVDRIKFFHTSCMILAIILLNCQGHAGFFTGTETISGEYL